MFTSIPDLQSVYEGPAIVPASNRGSGFTPKEEPMHNKTKADEDREMFLRYWRYVRKYRKRREFEKAMYWIGEMKKIKRFMNTTKEGRYPDIYSRCHGVVSFLSNTEGMRYKDITGMSSASMSVIKSILTKNWKDVAEDYVTRVYNELMPEAQQRGYDGY